MCARFSERCVYLDILTRTRNERRSVKRNYMRAEHAMATRIIYIYMYIVFSVCEKRENQNFEKSR